MTSEKRSKFNVLVELFDILFVMLLCFATLLATMLMRGKVIVGSGSGGGLSYNFNIASFTFTALFLLVYLFYIIRHSGKELKSFYSIHYDRKKNMQLKKEMNNDGRNGS